MASILQTNGGFDDELFGATYQKSNNLRTLQSPFPEKLFVSSTIMNIY